MKKYVTWYSTALLAIFLVGCVANYHSKSIKEWKEEKVGEEKYAHSLQFDDVNISDGFANFDVILKRRKTRVDKSILVVQMVMYLDEKKLYNYLAYSKPDVGCEGKSLAPRCRKSFDPYRRGFEYKKESLPWGRYSGSVINGPFEKVSGANFVVKDSATDQIVMKSRTDQLGRVRIKVPIYKNSEKTYVLNIDDAFRQNIFAHGDKLKTLGGLQVLAPKKSTFQ